jgi:hypothetical protein
MSPLVSADRFPLIDVRLKAPLPAVETESIMASYRSLAGRGKRIALIVDMRGFDAAKADPKQRRMSGDIYRKASVELRPSIVCEARVIPGALARYALTAFTWITGSPWPSATFSTAEEAEAWVRAKLAKDAEHFSAAAT